MAAAVALASAACGGPAGPGGGGSGLQIEIAGGDRQTGPAGSLLPIPLRVRVTRDGSPAASVALSFAATGASGTLPNPAALTQTDGFAEATYQLGPAGSQSIQVTAAGETASATFTLTSVAADPIAVVATIPVPPNYGIHDTFVRDGVAFVCAWNTGVIVYDVGDGRSGGSPSHPVEIGRIVTRDDGVAGGPAAHNAWWFHNPVSGERRYLFVGQEGPGEIGASSSGDIHVVDVSDLAHPVEVGSVAVSGAGAHNFWMDESRQVLYAAYYNAGVIAVDVSGHLEGDLSGRIIARKELGGPGNTYTWGVMLANGSLWASDMVSGFWRLDPMTLAVLGGGNNVPSRWGSDLWVRGSYGYSGTWGAIPRGQGVGDAILIWRVDAGGPTLADSVIVPNIRTVSDLEVSDDGTLLVATTERLTGPGLKVYGLANPAKPVLRAETVVATGLHTGSLFRVGGRLYVFAARNPPDPALVVYDITPGS